jgi:hypothetical protein
LELFPGFSRLPALLRTRALCQRRKYYHRASPVFCLPKCGLCSPHRPSPAPRIAPRIRSATSRFTPGANVRGKPCCGRKPGRCASWCFLGMGRRLMLSASTLTGCAPRTLAYGWTHAQMRMVALTVGEEVARCAL